MAELIKKDGFDVWTISSPSGGSRASFVPALGGIGSSLVLPGPDGPEEQLYQHEFFWDPDTHETRGGAPFCFPICGRLNRDGRSCYEVNGRILDMPIHGFALNRPWTVISSDDPDRLVMCLEESEETLAMYPFAFRLELCHTVKEDHLVTEMTCMNRSSEYMPYYAGFHPYLTVPGPGKGKEQTTVAFSSERRLVYNDDLTRVVGERPAPSFPLSITDQNVNEMLNQVVPGTEAVLARPDGINVCLEASGCDGEDLFPYIQMYTMPNRGFFCIEPWMGYPNMLNEPDVVHRLPPGASETGRLVIRVASSPGT